MRTRTTTIAFLALLVWGVPERRRSHKASNQAGTHCRAVRGGRWTRSVGRAWPQAFRAVAPTADGREHPRCGSHGGPALVAKSPADGYTLLMNTSAQAYSAALLKNLPYEPSKDFIPVASLTSQPYVLVAGKPAGVTTVGRAHCGGEGKTE